MFRNIVLADYYLGQVIPLSYWIRSAILDITYSEDCTDGIMLAVARPDRSIQASFRH